MVWRIMRGRLRSQEFEKVKRQNSKVKTMEEQFVNFGLKEEERPYNIRHRCYYFSKEIVMFVKDCANNKVFSSLFDQLIRSATSIGANIVEGKSGSSRKDWKNFYVIALKSANETKYWLCLIRIQWKLTRQELANY